MILYRPVFESESRFDHLGDRSTVQPRRSVPVRVRYSNGAAAAAFLLTETMAEAETELVHDSSGDSGARIWAGITA